MISRPITLQHQHYYRDGRQSISDGDATVPGAGNNANFNLQANAVQAGSTNTFNGFDGNDTFNVNFAGDHRSPLWPGRPSLSTAAVQAATAKTAIE